MKKYFEVLRKCQLFDGIEDENLIAILSCLGARTARYERHRAVMTEGEAAREVGILLSGEAQIERVDYFGNRSIMATVGKSELFGESFAFAESKHIPVSVVATEDCEVLWFDAARLTRTCGNSCHFHQTMIYNMMRNLAVKNLIFHQKIEVVSGRTTREKLMTYLTLQAKRLGRRRFEIPYDRQALADYLEVDRSGLSAEIGKLKKEGIINCRKNDFELLV